MQHVVSAETEQRVVAGARLDRVAEAIAGDQVGERVARSARRRAGQQQVLHFRRQEKAGRAAVRDDHVAPSAVQFDDDVLDALDLEYVVAFAPVERVPSGAAVQGVVPGAACQAVRAGIADHPVGGGVAGPVQVGRAGQHQGFDVGVEPETRRDCTVSSPAFGASKTMSAALSTR